METKRVARRKHSAELRAQVVQACRQSGASVAAIALRSGLNANLVHRWLREDGRFLDTGAGNPAAVSARAGAEFMPLQLPAPAVVGACTDIRVELRRGASTITVSWPLQGAHDCAAWLREWLR
jgi:transposase-like protein